MNLRFWNRALVSVATVLVGVLSLWGSSAFDYHLVHEYEFGAAPGGRSTLTTLRSIQQLAGCICRTDGNPCGQRGHGRA